MKTKGKREEAESPWLGTMCGMLKGGALAFLTAVAILFLCALAVSNRWLGQGMMDSAVMAACALGALAGGLLAVRQGRGRSLLMGFGAGRSCSCCCSLPVYCSMSQRICATAGWDCCSPVAAAAPWRAYWGENQRKNAEDD